MKLLTPAILVFLPLILVAKTATYSNAFQSHYPVRGANPDSLASYALEEPLTYWDEKNQRKLTIQRTKGDKYPYEEQQCVITILGDNTEPARYLSAKHFRTVRASWITRKLVLIRIGIGHVAAVEAIYDVDKDLWVYRESIQYPINDPQENRH